MEITRDNFGLSTSSDKEALEALLQLNSENMATYSDRVGVSIEELENAPIWAINSLADLLNEKLVAVGYFIKDNKATSLLRGYEALEVAYQEKSATMGLAINTDAFVREDGDVKLSSMIRIEDYLRDRLV